MLVCLEAIEASQDIDTIFSLITAYASEWGMDYMLIANMAYISDVDTIEDAAERANFLRSSYPNAWLTRYIERAYIRVDPVVSHCQISTRPFTYADAYKNNTSEQEAFRSDAEKHGMIYGYIIPMHIHDQEHGIVTYVSKTDIELTTLAKTCLEITARVAYHHIAALSKPVSQKDNPVLTEREKQILLLVAQGKTNWEVGEIIKLSEYSVRDYMVELSQKLDTSNRTHTVTRALQLGLIVL